MFPDLRSAAVFCVGFTAVSLLSSSLAQAAIVGAVGAVATVGGPGYGDLTNTYNQAGLSAAYTPGVTDFDTFTGTTTHSYQFLGQEWWRTFGSDVASVTYDLGAVLWIDKLALWNEDAVSIGQLDLASSTDGVSFTGLASGLAVLRRKA